MTDGGLRRPRARLGVAALAATFGAAASIAALGGGAADGAPNGASERRAAKTVRTLPTHKKLVALTFDAGSDTGHTKLILRVLRREKVQASFGVTGRWVEQNRKLTRRIAKRGHTIINHTYSHSSWTGLSAGSGLDAKARRRELKRTDRLVRKFTDTRTKPWFRPPYGDFDAAALRPPRLPLQRPLDRRLAARSACPPGRSCSAAWTSSVAARSTSCTSGASRRTGRPSSR